MACGGGGGRGTCPIGGLGSLALEHWDICEICSWFGCPECAADPEDMGLGAEAGAPGGPEDEQDMDIPF